MARKYRRKAPTRTDGRLPNDTTEGALDGREYAPDEVEFVMAMDRYKDGSRPHAGARC